MSEIAESRRALRRWQDEGAWRWRKHWLTLRARILHPGRVRDARAARDVNAPFFERLGVARERAEELCRTTLERLGREYRPRKQSIHYLAFAALRESGLRPANVLEVGTYRGDTTRYLASLFPDARIYTIELPDDDPLLSEYHLERERAARVESTLRSLTNVTPLRINTLDLQRANLPIFDLVWLDGAHFFPEVAWDHFYCLDHLAPGGWLFSDDVILPGDRFYRKPEHLEVHRVLEYISRRRKLPFGLLLKREDPLRMLVRPKYVAYLQNAD